MELIIAAGIGLVVLFILYRIFRAFLKWALILIIASAVVAYFTNPDEAKHRQAVKDNTRYLKRKVKEKQVEIKDYKIFSVTKVTVNGEEKKTVGVGAFGKIWFFGDIEEKLKR